MPSGELPLAQNPVRDLPRAIAISCVIVLIIYVLTIVSFHTTLSPSEVKPDLSKTKLI